ncbi:MAG TPA: hypothetical protein VMR81_04735 [Patescibacteria group bacterium]|nr:hypothetical protein [Patescibacteria group bacterium]
MQENLKLQLNNKEQHSLFIAQSLDGRDIDKWMRAIDIVSSGAIPGESFAMEHLGGRAIISPEGMHKRLVEGALYVAQENNFFNSPEFDEKIPKYVGRALATTMIWQDNTLYSRKKEEYFTQTMRAIDKVQSNLSNVDNVVDYQFRLWKLVQMGLDTFSDDTFKNGTEPHNKSWYAKKFLSSLIIEDAQSEMLEGDVHEITSGDLEITSGLVGAALEHNVTDAREAFIDAAVKLYKLPLQEDWRCSPVEMKKITTAWKQQIAHIAVTIANDMDSRHWHNKLLVPLLKGLNYQDEEVRSGIVDYMLRRFVSYKKEFEPFLERYLYYGTDQRIGILFLRWFKPTDRRVRNLINKVRKIPTQDVDIEIAELYAWWDAHDYHVGDLIGEMLDEQAERRHGSYAKMVRYMPRMMSVDGGLSVVRHGLAFDLSHERDQAAIGLLTAIDTWRKKGILTGEMGRVEKFLDLYQGRISQARMSDIKRALYGTNVYSDGIL